MSSSATGGERVLRCTRLHPSLVLPSIGRCLASSSIALLLHCYAITYVLVSFRPSPFYGSIVTPLFVSRLPTTAASWGNAKVWGPTLSVPDTGCASDRSCGIHPLFQYYSDASGRR